MAASIGDYRPLLSGGLWLAGIAAVTATLYGISAPSSMASALGFEFALIAVTVWAARSLYRRRLALSAASHDSASIDSQEPAAASTDQLHLAAQTQAMVLGGVAAIVGLFAVLQLLQLTEIESGMADDRTVFGIVCLAAAFVCLVLARSFQSIDELELPEAPALGAAFREAQWAALIAAIGLIGSSIEPSLLLWANRLVLAWVVIVCLETVLRTLVGVLIPIEPAAIVVAPVNLLMREAICTASNPFASLVRTIENRGGVSLRSSWAVSFVKRSTLPLIIFLMVLCWGLTSLSIVETNQMAVREHFGRLVGGSLGPGLHLTLPWPFGRIRAFPVKTVQQLPIGFVEADEAYKPDQPRALLWTKPHAKEEFALVLGDGSDLVAVNALIYFKISEDPEEFLDFVYRQSSPEETLTAFAYRAFMEQTRGRTLDDVLSINRAAFANRVTDSIRQQTKAAKLGLEVVELALLNLHPPIEAGGSYLEVINARLDARRRVTEAEGERQVTLLEAQTHSSMTVANAKTDGSHRVANALSETSEFKAAGQALQSSPTYRFRLWIESLENALFDQRLFLVDPKLLNEGGELLLDTRPQPTTRLPALNAPSPFPAPGANRND